MHFREEKGRSRLAGQRSRSTFKKEGIYSKMVFTNIEQQMGRTSKRNNAVHQKGKKGKDKMTTMNNPAFTRKARKRPSFVHSVSKCRDSGIFAGP